MLLNYAMRVPILRHFWETEIQTFHLEFKDDCQSFRNFYLILNGYVFVYAFKWVCFCRVAINSVLANPYLNVIYTISFK